MIMVGEDETKEMEFRPLESMDVLEEIATAKDSSIIFKHNINCPISKSVKRRLEEEGDVIPQATPVYLLDLVSHRDISDSIAGSFNVPHQSPQLLVIKDGRCIYNESLYQISPEETAQALEEANV